MDKILSDRALSAHAGAVIARMECPERDKFINDTGIELQNKVGPDFFVEYVGELSWRIHPVIKFRDISISYDFSASAF